MDLCQNERRLESFTRYLESSIHCATENVSSLNARREERDKPTDVKPVRTTERKLR